MASLKIFITFLILESSVYCQRCVRDPNDSSVCTFDGIERSKQLGELIDSNSGDIKKIQFVNSFTNRIPTKLTEVYKNLLELDMSNSLVCVLRNYDFQSPNNLQKLNLSGNVISYLESNLSYVLQNLEVLDLSRNKIHVIEDNMFFNLTKLKYLNLSHNKIKKLPPDFESNTLNVEDLDLSSNLMSILNGNFSTTTGASRKLNLSNNNLVSVNPKLFINLAQLNINFNKLEGAINFHGTNLKELLIRGNSLQLLTINKELISLDVSENYGDFLEINFENDSALEMLKLSNLKLVDYTSILENVAKLNQLTYLDLSMNNLTSFDFDLLPKSLKFLNLKQTQLTVLKNFKNLTISAPNLTEIILNGNFLKDKELLRIAESFKETGIKATGLEMADEIKIIDKKPITALLFEHEILIATAVSVNILLFIVNLSLTALLHR